MYKYLITVFGYPDIIEVQGYGYDVDDSPTPGVSELVIYDEDERVIFRTEHYTSLRIFKQ